MNYSSQPTTLMRPLGGIEHTFWLKDQHMPYHFGVCAEISGPTTVKAWHAAFDMVQQCHPHLSVKIERDKNRAPCFHRVTGAPIPLRVITDHMRWEPEMEREMATPFDAQTAPLARVVLLHQAQRTILILSAHHSIADTKSLIFIIRDALRALCGEVLVPLPPAGSLDSMLAPFHVETPDEAPQPEAPPPMAAEDLYRTPDGSFPRIKSLALSPDLTTKLRQRSRAEETTVHGALVAAAVEASRQLSSRMRSEAINVCSAIDARPMIGAGEEIALLSGGGMFSMGPQTRAFWETARVAKRKLAPAQAPEAMARMMNKMAPILAKGLNGTEVAALMVGMRFELNISNLGNLSVETRFGDLTFERLWGPSILAGFKNEQEIGVATVGGSLGLLHTSYNPLPSLLETMEKLLAAACA